MRIRRFSCFFRLALPLIAASAAHGVDFSSTSTGVWGDAAIWDPSGGPPNLNTGGNTATVGHAITYSGGSTTTPVNAAFQMSNGTSLTLNSGGAFNNTSSATWFMAGFQGDQITLNLNGGSVLNPGNAQIAMFGLIGGSALVNINEGTLRAGTNNTENSNFVSSGGSSINVGITSNPSNAAGTINVGDGSGDSGSAVIDLATNNRNLNIGWVSAAGVTGKVKGVVNVSSDGLITAGTNSQIRIGRGAALNDEASELNITGGSVNAPGALNTIIIGGLLNGAHGRLSLNSGSLSAGTVRLANSNATIKGEYRQSGGAATIGTIDYHHGNADVLLTGGTTTVNAFTFTNPAGSPGTRTLLLNGGTLRAGADSAAFLPAGGNFTASLGTNGGTIDTNGFNITIAAPTSGDGGLTKTGAGVLTLTGNHSHSGTTSVAQGKLLVNGTVGGGAVTIAPAGTLGGGGTITGPVTVGGTLAPGGSTGTLVTNEVTFNGGSSLAIGINDWTGDTAGTHWNLLDATELVFNNTPSSKLTLVISGNPAGFSESPKILAITRAITSITGFDASAIEIDDSSFTGTGTWTVRQNVNDIELVYAAGAGNTYAAWAATNAGNQAPDLDFDQDGVPNGMEYFMGETGTSFTANPGVTNGKVTWPMSPTFGGSYVVQTSTDLVNWSPATGVVETPGVSVQYTLPTGGPQQFVRLEVTVP